PITWQAVVLDPELSGIAALTPPIVRHIAVDPQRAATRFEEVTLRAGLKHTFTTGNTHTGGVAFVDLNQDHWPDLYISNGAGSPSYLYRNEGDGTFTDVSEAVRKPSPGLECAGVKAADIDNDGDLDLIVPVDNPQTMISFVEQPHEGGPNLLYINEGGLRFREGAQAAGLIDPLGRRTAAAAVADHDRDGCIDLYLVNWAMASLPAGNNPDRLLRGACDGTFTEVASPGAGWGLGRDGLVAFWWDADHDLYPDLYVGNNSYEDRSPDFVPDDVLYRNHEGVLSEWSLPGVGQDAWAAMGVDVGDIDADGDWDLYVTDVWELPPSPQGNVLYLGQPDGSLSANACAAAGLCFGYNSWPANFEDFDNDGWIDLWVGSSLPEDPDMLFINEGDGSGRFVSHRQSGWLGHTARAGTTADFDGDGDVDIFLWDESASSSLWRNHRMDEALADRPVAHWIQLALVGTTSNRAAIGAVARLSAGGVPMMRRVTGGDSAHSHRELTLHFGLGSASRIDSLELTWPSGHVQSIEGLAVDRLWIIDEDEGVIEHTLLEASAVLGPDGTLQISARSSYGGRARLRVEGLGPLTYDAASVSYSGTFEPDPAPDEVWIVADLGGETQLTVEASP
ncbi:MAG TPA: CRTAC1 family protein, partial [Deltaproteobacteria bacterium]|nr:CRTAC1 family protein [Deltaproteobacteria bacterium]